MNGIDIGIGHVGMGGQVADAERRLDTLLRLLAELRRHDTPADVAREAARILAGNHADLPALGFYVVGPGEDAVPPVPPVTPVVATFGDERAADALALAHQAARSAQRQESTPPATASEPDGTLHAYPLAEDASGRPSMILVVAVPTGHAGDATWQGYASLLVSLLSGVLTGMHELASERLRGRLLYEVDAAKSTFLANVSHELRTPLALIAAPVQDALGEPSLPDAARRRLILAQHNVGRLTRMVDAMLDFSRIEAGRIGPAVTELDVSALTRALCDAFAPIIEQAGLRLRTDIASLPRPARLDHDMYERMLLNLLANAVKYTPSGSIEVTLTDAGDRFRVSVADTGVGIPAADRERVFTRFVQLPPHAQARSTEGAGIGLAMVAQLADLLGGRVELQSRVGVGSTFTLDLPYDVPAPALPAGGAVRSVTRRDVGSFLREMASWRGVAGAPASVADELAQLEQQQAARRLRLLIVEDSADLRGYLADALADEYDIETATDGEDALRRARARRPHVILSDVMMPGLDGLALVREIRADPELRLVPVLLLSARAGLDAVVEGIDEGADDYIEKPFSLGELRARLASNAALALARSSDAAWRRAIIGTLQTALLIADPDGLVTELSGTFTEMLGWSLADGPFRPPYPWWPDPARSPEEFRRISADHDAIVEGRPMAGEYQLRSRDGRTVWAHYWGVAVTSEEFGRRGIIKSLRDVTREHDSRARREAVARIVAGFADATELDQLLADAVRGFGVLFDGRAHLRVVGGRAHGRDDLPETVFTDQGPLHTGELGDVPLAMLQDGDVSGGATANGRRGIVIRHDSPTLVRCLTWVEFPAPRAVSADELIVGDLLARALDIAVDRLLAAEDYARRLENLERAVESHRFVGQAVGILVERHRIPPADAFDRLRQASQNRNVKLRELASRVIETGADPEEA